MVDLLAINLFDLLADLPDVAIVERNPHVDITDDLLACIRSYEGDYSSISEPGLCIDGDFRCYGAYQWSHDAWFGNFPGRLPKDVPAAEQDALAREWIERRGLSPWPKPMRKCRP